MSAATLQWVALAVLGATPVGVLVADALDRRRAGALVAVVGLWAAAFLTGVMPFLAPPETAAPGLLGGGGISACIIAAGALAVTAGVRRFTDESSGGQQAALIAFAAGATALMAAASDLVVLFVAVEASALAAFGLVSASKDRRSEEASIKYFVQSAVATGAFVLAIAVMVGLYGGATGYEALAEAIARGVAGAAPFAMMLLVAVFAFKLAAFPFQWWAPDAYEAAPAPAAAFLAGAPKLAAVVAATVLIKQTVFASSAPLAGLALGGVAVASIAYGNLVGLKQTSYARMLAYSGVAQAGYLFVGLAVIKDARSWPVAVLGATYALAVTGAFASAEAFGRARPGWDGSIAGLAGIGRKHPWLGAATTACLLSLTGIPLTAGFWGKFYVFGVAVVHDLGWLALIGVIGSVISFGYYGGVIKAMYFDEAPEGAGADAERDPWPTGVALVAALAVVAVGVTPVVAGVDWLARFLGA